MKNHFLFSYAGNKRDEVENIYNAIKHLITNDIKIIIEPYCGTSAFSYYLSILFPNRFKYIINDNNKHLYDLITISKDEEKLNLLIEKLNNTIDNINNKEEYKSISDEFEKYIIHNKWHSIHAGIFPIREKKPDFKTFENCPIVNFLRNEDVEILNIDGLELINQYEDNKEVLFFIDPPYIQSCNMFYLNPGIKIYEWVYNNDLQFKNSTYIFCLENMWIIQILFKKYKLLTSYNKKYSDHKKNLTIHAVYSSK